MIGRVVGVCIVAAGLAGCSSNVSSSDFAIAREAVRGSPAAFNAVVNSCVTTLERSSAQSRAGVAMVVNASVAAAPRIACRRMTRAMADGRLSRAEINGMANGSITPKMVRIMQGRG